MDFIKWILALIGHIGFWAVLFNRLHATALNRTVRKASEKLAILFVLVPLVWICVRIFYLKSLDFKTILPFGIDLWYGVFSIVVGAFLFFNWAYRRLTARVPDAVLESRCTMTNVANEVATPLLHGTLAKLLGRLPFNEALCLSKQEMSFAFDIPKQMSGLKVCQLSDLHYTGQIGIEYFQRVVDEANAFEPDLILITGDIVDEDHCLDWIEPTLGRLQAPLGVFYVLGNHDRRVEDENRLRSLLENAGIQQASGCWRNIEFRDGTIQVTGNALPWYNDVEGLPPPDPHDVDLRILISHSPDQFPWAQALQADLLLAGHTHGGQIALPIIGPIIAPSRHGVAYASGTFQMGEMVMHVSRGLSGDEPIRIGSLPELGLFTIVSNQN